MHLYITRHGETDFNLQNRYAGKTDVQINPKGLQQAEALSEKLKNIHFDVIISSPLIRAKTTADIICKHHMTTTFVVYDEFTERNMGSFEGLTKAEVRAKYPNHADVDYLKDVDNTPPNGETLLQMDKRINVALDKIIQNYANKTVLVVCHGFVSSLINRRLNALDFSQTLSFMLQNCQVVEYKI